MLYVVTYIAAALSTAAVLYALGLPRTVAEGALVSAVAALFAVAIVYGITPERLAAWHDRRARALVAKSAEISTIWGPLVWPVWLAITIAEVVHVRRAEALSS